MGNIKQQHDGRVKMFFGFNSPTATGGQPMRYVKFWMDRGTSYIYIYILFLLFVIKQIFVSVNPGADPRDALSLV